LPGNYGKDSGAIGNLAESLGYGEVQPNLNQIEPQFPLFPNRPIPDIDPVRFGKIALRDQPKFEESGKNGEGFFDDVNKFLKDSHLISNVANTVGNILPGQYGAIANTVGQVANTFGYGDDEELMKEIRRQYAIRGQGFFDDVNKFLKDTHLVSGIAKTVGSVLPGTYGTVANTVGQLANSFGYGGDELMKAIGTRYAIRGQGFFDDVNKFLKNSHIISNAANIIGSALPGQYGAIANTVGQVANSFGYGDEERFRPIHRHPVMRNYNNRHPVGQVASSLGLGNEHIIYTVVNDNVFGYGSGIVVI